MTPLFNNRWNIRTLYLIGSHRKLHSSTADNYKNGQYASYKYFSTWLTLASKLWVWIAPHIMTNAIPRMLFSHKSTEWLLALFSAKFATKLHALKCKWNALVNLTELPSNYIYDNIFKPLLNGQTENRAPESDNGISVNHLYLSLCMFLKTLPAKIWHFVNVNDRTYRKQSTEGLKQNILRDLYKLNLSET